MRGSGTVITVQSVAWDDPDAVALRSAMEGEMQERYAARFAAFPLPPGMSVAEDSVAYTGVAVTGDGRALGHVALRWHGEDLEIKRLYVDPSARGAGVAVALLKAAEDIALSLGAPRLILQTGDRQPDAVRLYEKTGYTRIPIFPPYDALPFSQCFEKALAKITVA